MTGTDSPYSFLAQTAYATLREEILQYVMQRYKRQPIRPGLLLDSDAIFEPIDTAVCMGRMPASDAGPGPFGAFQQANHRFLFDVRSLTMLFVAEEC